MLKHFYPLGYITSMYSAIIIFMNMVRTWQFTIKQNTYIYSAIKTKIYTLYV